MDEEENKVAALNEVLGRVYRFPHNANVRALLREVYGESTEGSVHDAYIRGKWNEVQTRGFTAWWCDLDLTNQRKVAKAMLDRYEDLKTLLK